MKAERRSPRAMRWSPEIRDEGTANLRLEQNSSLALGIADGAYVTDHGRIVHTSRAGELEANSDLKHRPVAV